MKIRNLILFFALFAIGALSAQVTPVAELDLPGNGKSINIHDFTGIPVIQTTEAYVAVNPVTREELWRIDRKQGAGTMEALGGEVSDYFDILSTAFAYVNGSIVNVVTGDVLVDGAADEIKGFSTFYIVPDADLVLVELQAKGAVRLYGLDPFAMEKKWGVQLREQSGLGQAVGSLETDGPGPYVIPPLLTAAGNLLYHNDKFLASIDLSKGNLQWNNKLNPGYIFQNDDATKLLVAEKRGGLGGAMTGGGDGGAPRKFSKSLYLLDASTGESLWTKGDSKMDGNIQFIMPYDGGYMVVHDEGFNIYDYTPGKQAEGRWKKDYSEKGIKDIIVQDDGLMLYFKNRRMLIDPATGDDVWRKAEKLEREPSAFFMARRTGETQVGDNSFYRMGNRMIVNTNGRTNSYNCDAYDYDEDSKLLVITDFDEEENGSVIKVGPWPHKAWAVNMESGETKRTGYGLRKAVQGVSKVENGYFFYNDRAFALVDFDGSSWTKVKEEYYPDPSRGERFLKGAVGSLALGAASVQNGLAGSSAVITNDAGAVNRYEARQNALEGTGDVMGDMVKRRRVGRVEAEFAYFFARNDDNDLVLFKIDKDTGEDVKQYPFSDKQPVYEVDNASSQLFYIVDNKLQVFEL
ncbi:MAG: PQQ-binding-like beta-propeller repeat protein [Bacteroidota bacterium]